jgi:hypothetical protein
MRLLISMTYPLLEMRKMLWIILRRSPYWISICAKCNKPFPLNMSDYLARQQFLELFGNDVSRGSVNPK